MSKIMVSEVRGLARSSTLNLVGGATTAVATLALLVVLTRGMGTTASGVVLSVVALFQVLIAIAGLGVETGVVRFITARGNSGSTGIGNRQLRSVAFAPVLVMSVAIAVALTVLADWVGQTIGGTMASEAAAATRLIAPFLPAGALANSVLGATRGYMTMRPTVVIERIGRPLIQLGMIAVAVAVGASVATLTFLWASAYVAQLASAWVWLHRLERRQPAGEEATAWLVSAREFWTFTLPRAAATTFRVTLQWLDVVLVAALASPGDAAVYAVATRMLQLGLITAFAVGQAVEPMFGRAVAAGDNRRTLNLYKTATSWLILLTWPFYLILAFFAAGALALFGTGFEAGTGVVVILVVSVLFGAAAGPVDILLVMTGKSSWSFWNTAVSLTTNIALNLWLIPVIGIEGAAVAWTVSRILANVLPLYQLARFEKLHPFGPQWTLAVVTSVATFGLIAGGARTLWGPGIGVGVAAALVATGLFVGSVRHFRQKLAIDLAFSALRRAST